MKVDNLKKEKPVYFRGIELQCDLEAEHKALNWVLSEDKEQLEEMRKQYKGAVERVKSHPVKVKNQWGRIIYFEDAFCLMDDDICEDLKWDINIDSSVDTPHYQEFFDAYCKEHEKKFGETFVANQKNPQM